MFAKMATLLAAAFMAASFASAGTATAALREVIVLQSLDAGNPPLIYPAEEDRLKMASGKGRPIATLKTSQRTDRVLVRTRRVITSRPIKRRQRRASPNPKRRK
jgi:hypothetical protein